MGVVVGRYMHFLILLSAIRLVLALFCRASLLFVHFFNVFSFLFVIFVQYYYN